MVKNEQDIVEPWIRHHMNLLDVMVVIDNGSDDDTRRILAELASEFSRLVVVDAPSSIYEQAFFLTAAFRQIASRLRPGFVVFLDGDEFLPAIDREDLLLRLDPVPNGGIGLMQWKTYCHHPDDPPSRSDPLEAMRWRRATETPIYKIVARPGATLPWHWYVATGSHRMGSITGQPVPSTHLDLPLLHFPLRNADQLLAKGAIGWLRSGVGKGSMKNFQWRMIHDEICGGRTVLTYRELCEHALVYAQPGFDLSVARDVDWNEALVQEPHGIRAERRYSTGQSAPVLTLAVKSISTWIGS
jgi:hypothetical protein